MQGCYAGSRRFFVPQNDKTYKTFFASLCHSEQSEESFESDCRLCKAAMQVAEDSSFLRMTKLHNDKYYLNYSFPCHSEHSEESSESDCRLCKAAMQEAEDSSFLRMTRRRMTKLIK